MSGFGNSKAAAVSIRPARTDEQKMLESLQRRASLSNPGDRDALLANPDAIAVPLEQLAEGCVFVAERAGAVVGFAAVIKRPDGVRSSMRCLSSPTSGSTASDAYSLITLRSLPVDGQRASYMSSATLTRKGSTSPAASASPAPSKRSLGSGSP